eukprot:TRINITY_DN32625_c0_g1_i1.p3 TRINITY_DN32625_c0_g1~~TRINITY_DN32625_c0_g1_i1.p3  ORF type:complete len:160 (-),score=47.57 TRINITY_DN32625_c0_g1_i1:38-517(-)
MEDEVWKIAEADGAGKWLPVSEEEVLDVESLGIEEGMVEEVMKGLEMEINGQGFLFPYSSSDFVTINGNEETCGPSFSDSASTVMASIDMGGAGILNLVEPTDLCSCCGGGGGWEMGALEQKMEEESAVVAADADADVEESDEEWLARVLNSPAFEFEI